MANHVTSQLLFRVISDEGKQRFSELLEVAKSRDPSSPELHLGFFFTETLDEIDINYMCERVGAKWAFCQDYDDISMTFYSAWSPIDEFVAWIVGEVAMVDESVVATYTYEDEMPNFIGASVYTAEGLEDSYYCDSEELVEEMRDKDEDLQQLWDPEEEWFTEEGEELYRDSIWDYSHDLQMEFFDGALSDLMGGT